MALIALHERNIEMLCPGPPPPWRPFPPLPFYFVYTLLACLLPSLRIRYQARCLSSLLSVGRRAVT